ncbi:MAG: (2Fe-2S)-binding protein [Elusimicrobia bacterium]|nr:(2Fe-2S)-binding protein [Elusimicrobiota bacterium]
MKINFILNDNIVNIDIRPDKPLLRMLREDLGIKSVKEGCGRGECGSCTVLVDNKPVASCMVPAGQVHTRKVTTLEGLESSGEIKQIQDAFVKSGAVQCGFCTPGFMISAYSLLTGNPNPEREEIRAAVSGNVCRCTGYTKIIDAIELAAEYIRRFK